MFSIKSRDPVLSQQIMGFDRAKAMRNAERFVAQGKIRAAIDEYRSVVDNDPRDIATLNMLGDLHAKNSEKKEAVRCYMRVAEHYAGQGFSQKAIAIYNKISRIQPDTVEVTEKLAELHKNKGSLSDARAHYQMLAEHYQKAGKRLEALAMYKQIAMLDPNNPEVCLNLADSYLRENQKDEALEAFAEAGSRLSRQSRHEEAIRALMKGFEIKKTDLRILNGLVKAQVALGRAPKAAAILEEILAEEPYNRDVLYLLIECCLDSQNAAGAERAVVKLVEIEPANYPRFLDLIRIYLNVNDPDSAARILTMSTEYLLAGGQSDECARWIDEILERDPDSLAALRLLCRYNSWLNDENGIRLAFERLYSAAVEQGSFDDERHALKQLVIIRPHETRYRDRLTEINETYGFEDEPVGDDVLNDDHIEEPSEGSPAVADDLIERNGHVVEAQIAEQALAAVHTNGHTPRELTLAQSEKLRKELQSIAFFIDNDYYDLAEKALDELADELGEQPEITEFRKRMGKDAPEHAEVVGEIEAEDSTIAEVTASALGIDEIRSEFGIDGDDASGDYDTHYQMGIAYQEMGLMEEAIREYQDAINLSNVTDGTRRFFQCATLLGHCFLQNGKPHHAVTWLERALDTPNISDGERNGVWYELGIAHEANGDTEKGGQFFEMIYAADVDFRDVSTRVRERVSD